eukprot:jgi/Botrbrau1/2828/Bobra.0125s0036.1
MVDRTVIVVGLSAALGLSLLVRRSLHKRSPKKTGKSWARPPEQAWEKAEAGGQQHIFNDWESLTLAQKRELVADVERVDLLYARVALRASQANSESNEGAMAAVGSIRPLVTADVIQAKFMQKQDEDKWIAAGCHLIAEGKLAILLLAGGQGTRLGSSQPKGCYDIGLPSGKSLFRLQAERIWRVQQLAADAIHASETGDCTTPRTPTPIRHPLRWYIMTSPATDAETRRYFQANKYFGLSKKQVVFFQQGEMPCMTEEGRVIMETPYRIAMAPDGNGGLYTALQRCGILDDMEQHGVEAVDCYSVDNALVQPGDPLFNGCCYSEGAECGARVVAKAYPEERVGVFARKGNKMTVVEYSELAPSEATSRDPGTGELRYNWSNVCMHFFKVSFLKSVATKLKEDALYHIARKKIPSKDGPVEGIKLELFIFDTFPMADKVTLFEVLREEEFAPVKNPPGSLTDSPDTARLALLSLHRRWVEVAGAELKLDPGSWEVFGVEGVEISPKISYCGEGLRSVCRDSVFRKPLEPILQGPT